MIGSICEYARWAIVTCTEMESVHAAMDGLLVFAVRLHYVFVVCPVVTIEWAC